jgi:CheY-like chemotaxis protein
MMSSLQRPLVVVADPDPQVRTSLVAQLSPRFRCQEASSLKETFQFLCAEPPALLLLERDHSDGDGLDLVRQLSEYPTLQRVLMVCVTSHASITDKLAAFQAGVDDYLVKPLWPTLNLSGRLSLVLQVGETARAVQRMTEARRGE